MNPRVIRHKKRVVVEIHVVLKDNGEEEFSSDPIPAIKIALEFVTAAMHAIRETMPMRKGKRLPIPEEMPIDLTTAPGCQTTVTWRDLLQAERILRQLDTSKVADQTC